ncbi:4Fe-4S dicluster domain-containing protein [Azotobacter chroococcum]
MRNRLRGRTFPVENPGRRDPGDAAPQRRISVEGVGAYSYPSRCQHCSDAACMTACPTGAMQRDGGTDKVFSDHDKCIGCWMCVVVCPFGGVTADPAGKKAVKCDGCPERTARGEAPACVAACPTDTLLYLTPRSSPPSAARPRRTRPSAAARAQPQRHGHPAILEENPLTWTTPFFPSSRLPCSRSPTTKASPPPATAWR